jgi:hypothetical protein
MALPKTALEDLWYAIRKDVPFDLALGICAHWARSPYKYGSVCGPERSAQGGPIQMFARLGIQWTPDGPVDVDR